MTKYCFGMDVGGTTVKCGLFTTEGEVLEKWEIPTRTENNGSAILPDIAQTILACIEKKGIDRAEVAGIGICVPGPVNEQGEIMVAVNLHWGRVDVKGEMEKLTGLKTCVGNDANVAALGELWKGGGSGYHNMILVTLGTGVGGGIIVNDKILMGGHGSAGEVGHAHVADEITEKCNCGSTGCLEQVASATGIARLARMELAASSDPTPLRDIEKVSAKNVFDAVKAGDPVAIRIAERFGKYLGTALSIYANVVDPDVIVVGGGVSKAGPVIFDFVTKYYRQYAFPTCKDTAFALAELGNDAGIYGCAKLVLE